ncbi:MAG TPA: hypothetical protein VM580_03785 [Labilithrix sp.]|nr:hypothetical protein [Labilithrix sp.]
MTNHIRWTLVAFSLSVFAFACDRGKAEAEKKAAEAEQQAQETTITAARVKAEEEEAKLKMARAEERSHLQKQLDAHERKADYLKDKAAKTAGATKQNANAAISELNARLASAKESVGKLADDTSPAWDAAKSAAANDLAAVERATDSLEQTLTKKKK